MRRDWGWRIENSFTFLNVLELNLTLTSSLETMVGKGRNTVGPKPLFFFRARITNSKSHLCWINLLCKAKCVFLWKTTEWLILNAIAVMENHKITEASMNSFKLTTANDVNESVFQGNSCRCIVCHLLRCLIIILFGNERNSSCVPFTIRKPFWK